MSEKGAIQLFDAVRKQTQAYLKLKKTLGGQSEAVKAGKAVQLAAFSAEAENTVVEIEALERQKEEALSYFSASADGKKPGFAAIIAALGGGAGAELEKALIELAKASNECAAEASKNAYLLKNRVKFLEFSGGLAEKEKNGGIAAGHDRTI